MNSSSDKIARLENVLRAWPSAKWEILQGDASTRSYYRIFLPHEVTRIAMVSSQPAVGEESAFLEVQNFLNRLDLPVPEVFEHHPHLGVVILEDLGDKLVESLARKYDKKNKEKIYILAVDLLLEMRESIAETKSRCRAFDLAFDKEKLMWELNFARVHFIESLCGVHINNRASELSEFFNFICDILASQPRIFTHRDYHSRNLIFRNGRIYMLDFQDARMGPAQYDLASLLRDSYVELSPDMVNRLLILYMDGVGLSETSRDEFRFIFDIMCLQRNIKALGTFGFQAVQCKNRRYLESVPLTISYVDDNVARHEDLRSFRELIRQVIVDPWNNYYSD